jgi:hypothetical protein
VTPIPAQTDYGFDGDVKLAELMPGALKARVLPVTFQYQLKSTMSRIRSPHKLRVRSSHLAFWAAHNVPTVIFLVHVLKNYRGGAVYAKLVDSTFLTDLESRCPRWRRLKTAPILFMASDRVRWGNKNWLAVVVKNWAPGVTSGTI